MLRRNCKACDAKYARENPQKIKKTKRKSYEKNRQKNLEYAKKYRLENKEAVASRDREYRKINAAKIAKQRSKHRENNKEILSQRWLDWAEKNRDYLKKYRIENAEHIQNKNKRYYEANKHKYYAWCRQRQAAKQNATPSWLTQEQKNNMIEMYWLANDLKAVSGQEYHVDHIIPLRGKNICGLHVPWNLQILPADLNLSKGANYEP